MSGFQIHGHRGSRGSHPENTIPSFEEARGAGCAFIELDVHLTYDGHVVVFHDFEITGKLCRDQDGQPVRQPMKIAELTLEQIKGYECGSQTLPAFPEQKAAPGERIPTLEEVIQWKIRRAPGMGLNIEIKRDSSDPGATKAGDLARGVAALLRKHDLLQGTLVQSFDFEVVRAMRKLSPEVRLSCLFENDADFAKVALEHQAQVAAPDHCLLNEEHVELCRKSGIEVLPWTVNDPADWKRLMEIGVRSIITDYPRKLSAFLASSMLE